MTLLEKFFEENSKNPTAWSVGNGYHVRFSMTSEVFNRNEIEVKKLLKKYKLNVRKEKNLYIFSS